MKMPKGVYKWFSMVYNGLIKRELRGTKSMSNPAKNCRWILADGTYCEAKVRYTLGSRKYANEGRTYASFCDMHEERRKHVRTQDQEDEDESMFE